MLRPLDTKWVISETWSISPLVLTIIRINDPQANATHYECYIYLYETKLLCITVVVHVEQMVWGVCVFVRTINRSLIYRYMARRSNLTVSKQSLNIKVIGQNYQLCHEVCQGGNVRED